MCRGLTPDRVSGLSRVLINYYVLRTWDEYPYSVKVVIMDDCAPTVVELLLVHRSSLHSTSTLYGVLGIGHSIIVP
jgi:hypothetical protein